MLAYEMWDVTPSCWKYPIESSSSSNWFTKVLKTSIYAAVVMVASKKMGPIMRHRDIPHQTLIFSEWWGSSWIALGFSLAQIRQFWELTNHERWNHASSENPSVVQNARIFLKKCLKPSTMPLFSLGQALLICGPQRYGTHEASLFSQHTDKCFWTTLIPVKVGAVTSWEMPVVGPSHFGSFPLTFLDDLLYAHPVKSSWFPVSSTRPKCWTCSADVGLQTSPGIAVDMTLSILFSNKCKQ